MLSKMTMRLALVAGIFVGLVASSPVNAERKRITREDAVERLERSERFLDEIMDTEYNMIPRKLMRRAKGIIILRQYKFGFIFGAKGGHGIAMLKDADTGQWGPPSFITTGEGSIGFQIGGQSVDSVFLIMQEDGLDILRGSHFRIGGDVSVAAGPIGRNAEFKVAPEVAILSYSKAKGLFAGISLEGGALWTDKDANEVFYGSRHEAEAILFENAVSVPSEVGSLHDKLEAYTQASIDEFGE
jgi:lipid-binding SYLF domain-containing protein